MPKKVEIAKILTGSDVLQKIQYSITILRGKQVLLDFQLAELYGVETKRLNEAVKRNIQRFPEDFMFRLSREELVNIRSQYATSYSQGADTELLNNRISPVPRDRRNAMALPYAFTEEGVAMLSSVLRSETAVQVNIAIMRAFVMARRILADTRENAMAINEMRLRMQMLEDALENNLGAVNDLTDEVRREVENIYNAIGELSLKQEQHRREPLPEIGYAAIDKRRRAEEDGKKKIEK